MTSSVRCLTVWGVATAVAALLVAWLLPAPLDGAGVGSGGFESWLVNGCAVAAAGCVTWGWVLTTLVVVDGWRGRPARSGVPRVVRRAVLAACGLSLAGGLAVPVHADRPAPPPESSGTTQALLVGLPLPDRTTTTTAWIGALGSGRTTPVADTAPAPTEVRVAPGDTLWSIARATLSQDAPVDEIDRRWRAIYRANLDTVGLDPDVIRPGQRLLLPPLESHPR